MSTPLVSGLSARVPDDEGKVISQNILGVPGVPNPDQSWLSSQSKWTKSSVLSSQAISSRKKWLYER